MVTTEQTQSLTSHLAACTLSFLADFCSWSERVKRAVLFVIVNILSFFAFAYSVIFNSDTLWLTAGFFFGTSLVIVFWAGVLWSRHQLFLNESRQSLQQRIDAADTQKGYPSQQQVDILEKKWHETKRPLAFIHFRRALRLRAEV